MEDIRRMWSTSEPLFVELVPEQRGCFIVNGVRGFMMKSDMELLDLFTRMLPNGATVVEVGSFEGLSTLVMARSAHINGINVKIHAVDPFLGNIEHQKDDAVIRGELYDNFKANVAASGLASMIIPRRMPSVAAAATFKDASVDMIYVDGDHTLQGCFADLTAWVRVLKPGGVFLGHDFLHRDGVALAVDKFMSETGDRWCVTMLNSHPMGGNMYVIHPKGEFLKKIYGV